MSLYTNLELELLKTIVPDYRILAPQERTRLLNNCKKVIDRLYASNRIKSFLYSISTISPDTQSIILDKTFMTFILQELNSL